MRRWSAEDWARFVTLICGVLSFAIVIALVVLSQRIEKVPTSPATFPELVGECLTHLVMCGYFAMLAFTFRAHRSVRASQLDEEFGLLGIRRRHEDIANQYRNLQASYYYGVQCAFPILVTVLGLSLFFRPPEAAKYLDENVLQALRYGFLGSYSFCLLYVYRRFTTADLVPSVFAYCGAIMIAGAAVNYAAFLGVSKLSLPTGEAETPGFTGVGAGLAAIVAFVFGYTPHTALRWFKQLQSRATNSQPRRADLLPLSLIDGVNEFHETRLRDEGIDNVENLASANIRDLFVNTPFGPQKIIKWIDQAILYSYLDPGEVESFKRGRVLCVTDFLEYWRPFRYRWMRNREGALVTDPPMPSEENEREELVKQRKAFAQQLQSTEERLDALFRTVSFGPNIAYVRNYWKGKHAQAEDERSKWAEKIKSVAERARDQRPVNLAISEARTTAIMESAVRQRMATERELLSDLEISPDAEMLPDVELSPDVEMSPHLLCDQAWFAYGVGEYDAAESYFREAIEKFPRESPAYNDLAWILAAQEKSLDDAIRFAETAVEMSEDPDYLDTLAFALFQQGNDLEGGLTNIDKAIRVAEKTQKELSPYYLHTLAKAAQKYQQADNQEQAQELVARIAELRTKHSITQFPATEAILDQIRG